MGRTLSGTLRESKRENTGWPDTATRPKMFIQFDEPFRGTVGYVFTLPITPETSTPQGVSMTKGARVDVTVSKRAPCDWVVDQIIGEATPRIRTGSPRGQSTLG